MIKNIKLKIFLFPNLEINAYNIIIFLSYIRYPGMHCMQRSKVCLYVQMINSKRRGNSKRTRESEERVRKREKD